MSAPMTGRNEIDERAIDRTLAQWVQQRTGSTRLAAAAFAASRAEGHGHACAWLADPHDQAHLDDEALAELRVHPWVGEGTQFSPFVLDQQQRFYLWRNWRHEAALAAAITQRCAARTLPLATDILAGDLDAWFADMPVGVTDWQRAAVAAVPGARLFVLTGGPGTGKTTTVVRMLLILLRHAQACGLPANPAIALAAPTGKAAQRLAQAIAKGKAELQRHTDPCWSDFSRELLLQPEPSRLKSLQQDPHRVTSLLQDPHLVLQHIPHANPATAHDKAEPQGHTDPCWSDFSRELLLQPEPSRLKSLQQDPHIVKSLPQELQRLLQHIPHADARTLHRLLGYQPHDNSFRHGKHNPLPADIVIVDEASMVDLAMMRQLFDALRPEAVLILLGDPGQLASVDAGSVLADIVASTPQNQFPPALAERLTPLLQTPPGTASHDAALAGQVVTLTHSWRAGSGLQHGIEALRDTPDPTWLEQLLTTRRDGDLHLRRCADSDALRTCVDRWIERHIEPLRALLTSPIDAAGALQILHQFQLLSALRDGPFGAQGLNALLARRLASRLDIDTSHSWYHGRPIIITRNDYARGLFNGDIGIALNGAEGLRVWFEVSDRDGNVGLRSYSPRALPAHESAWAITIHRSQGSEYRAVAVVLPPDDDNRILSRELVYTAVSRAKKHAEIWATDESLRAALARPIQRLGGLRERLQAGSIT